MSAAREDLALAWHQLGVYVDSAPYMTDVEVQALADALHAAAAQLHGVVRL